MTALHVITSSISGWSWADVYTAIVSGVVGALLGAAVFGVAMLFDPSGPRRTWVAGARLRAGETDRHVRRGEK
jgi:hypothetical protein